MSAASFDPTTSAFDLIAASAPERRPQLTAFWGEYAVRFEEVDDQSGIVMNANKDRVAYARKDFQIIWLLGFSLWKSIELFGPAVMAPSLTGASSTSALKLDTDLDAIERNYGERLKIIAQIIEAGTLDETLWPPDIPKAVASRDDLQSVEDKTVFDLIMMTTSVAYLHELRHVKFHRDHANGSLRPTDLAEEEMMCDVWARDWFMSKLGAYAKDHGHDFGQVCSKRAMALLFMCEFLRLANNHAGAIGSAEYPPLAERISALSQGVTLSDTDNFWIVSSCILFGEVRRQGQKLVQVPSGSPKEISEFLVGVLTP
jgi:hypothetical protein